MSPLLVGTVGGLILYLLVSGSSSSAWPPSSAVQQALVAQLTQMAQQHSGQPLNVYQTTVLQQQVQAGPAAYQAILPVGTAPTVAGYQQWMLQQGSLALAAGDVPGALSGAGATTSGPLGLIGGDPYPLYDVHGNALFFDKHGRPLMAWHANDPRGDFAPPAPYQVEASLTFSDE
jgi:hypothetical protein